MAETAAGAPRRAIPAFEGPALPALLRLALPNTLATLIQVMPILVEAWRIGALGGTPLAGVALVFPVFMLATMLSAGAIGGAVSGEAARRTGAGDRAGAEAVARAALVIALAGGLAMGALVLALGPALFRALGGEGAVLAEARAYAEALFPWIAVVWAFNMLGGVLRGAGDMLRPLLAIALVAGLHLVASGPVILGAAPGEGVAAAGRLLAACYGAGLVVVLAALLRPGARVRLRPGPLDGALIRRVTLRGLLAGSQSVTTIAMSLAVTAFAARFGPEVLAGYGLGARIELAMVPLIFGVGGAAIALCGAAAGAGRRDRAVRLGWTAAALAAVAVGTLGVVLAALGPVWTPVFAADPAVAAVTADYVARVGPVYAFFALGLALYFASQGLDTLPVPVIGALLRLAVVVAGGFLVFALPDPRPESLFLVVAAAMILYGLFTAGALHLGPWRPARA